MLKRYTGGEWVEQGGGGGTNDYADLSNKPKINNTTLSGNKTSSDLGLQPAINGSAKVNADYIDDSTSTNKFVTAADKTNWNAKLGPGDTYTKQELDDEFTAIDNAIDAVEAGAAAGATALQPEDVASTYNSSGTAPINGTGVAAALSTLDVPAVGGSGKYLSQISEVDGKVVAIPQTMDSTPTEDSYKAISSDGVWADQQRQETEIGAVANAGAKNLCPKETETSTGSGFTSDVPVNIPAGTYILSFTGTLAYTASLSLYRALPHSGNNLENINLSATTGEQSVTFTITEAAKYIAFYHNGSGNSLTNIMIRPASITDLTFQPYALSNPVITPALIDQVDEGVKNRFLSDKAVGMTETIHGRTFTIQSDGGVKVETTGTVDADADFYILGIWQNRSTLFDTRSKTWIPVCSCTTKSDNISLRIYNRSTGSTVASRTITTNDNAGNAFDFDLTCAFIKIGSDQTIPSGGIVVYPMICTVADYTVSSTLQPYADTNPVLTQEVNWNVNQGVKNLINLNPSTYTSGNVVVELNDDGTVSVSLSSGSTANTTFSRAIKTITNLRGMDLILNGCPSGGNYSSGYALYISDDSTTKEKDEGNGVLVPKNTTVTTSYLALIVRSGTAISGTLTFKPMIRPAYITDSTFQPYALPNPTLTPAVIKAVDEGAKNLFSIGVSSYTYASAVTCTVAADGKISVNGTNPNASAGILYQDLVTSETTWKNTRYTLPAGKYGCKGSGVTGLSIQVYCHDGTNATELFNSKDDGVFEYTAEQKAAKPYIAWRLGISASAVISNATVQPMICTAADWAISQKYAPYCPSLPEVYKGNLRTTPYDFASSLNSNIVSINDSAFVIYKYGNLCMARVSLKISGTLTGSDALSSTAVPADYRPIANVYQSVTGRDQGSWTLSTLEEASISVGIDGVVTLRTGSKASSTVYVIGTLTWICG